MTKIGESNATPLTKEILDGMKDENEKIQAIGNRLHPKIKEKVPDKERASRITGMLVGIQQSIILQILSNENVLMEYIQKAEQIMNKKGNKDNNNDENNSNVGNESGNLVSTEQLREKVNQMKKNQKQVIEQIIPQQNANANGS